MTTHAITPVEASGTADIVVDVADFAVAGGASTLSTAGLGSCVALVLYAPRSGVAGLAHFLLPEAVAGSTFSRPAKFAATGVPLLAAELRLHGATGPLQAKLVGGARMFGSLLGAGVNVGERNIEATRAALARLRIPIVAEEVGGEFGRSVRVEAATGLVRVRSLAGRDRDL
jgi:chemotaxis protein CheD